MKQLVAGLLAGVLIAAPAPAAAAPSDPVSALKSRIGAGKGVSFTDVTSFIELSGQTKIMTRTGTLQYGRRGFAASDVSVKMAKQDNLSTLFEHDERFVTIGKATYRKGAILGEKLPKGKSWVRTRATLPVGISGMFSQPVNAAEPETLKALITASEPKGRTYSGTITFRQLAKASPWTRLTQFGKPDDTVIRFTLTLGSGNLPVRLETVHMAEGHWLGRQQEGDEVRHRTVYKGWGARTTITAPPAKQVYTGKK
ncbi:hypothetical protein ACIBKY_43865 [Nonomuraea sp. NPDC050394]|uniref:hypothetical protein n=1 Tax=Nonomuraea sp. NPDC050394 TaxID=3364363 RepID=UPI0037BDE10C